MVRKVARKKAEGTAKLPVRVCRRWCRSIWPRRFLGKPARASVPGGGGERVAWTEAGGDLMTIEVTDGAGEGNLNLTGKRGEVMRESGVAAMTYARKNAEDWGLDKGSIRSWDTHIHVPEGAISQGWTVGRDHDGNGAGVGVGHGVPTRPKWR